MPLRDHFHGPLDDWYEWEGFHSAWANNIVFRLNTRLLPAGYRSVPHIRLGASVEVDVATFEQEPNFAADLSDGGNSGGVATAVWAPPQPALALAVDLPAQDIFEARIYDGRRGKRLVAAVEFVSPSNKDRPEHRRAFAVKCAAYLQQGVSLVVVDIVTERRGNLYVELMELLERTEAAPWPEGQGLYGVAYRTRKGKDGWQMDVWPEALTLGQPLPTLPLWIASDRAVPLELEASYEETCRNLRIP